MGRPLYNRDYILLLAANFLYSLYATVFIFLPTFLYGLDLREGEIGLIMATGTFTSVALRPATGLFIDRGGRTAFLVTGGLLASASTIPWLFVREPGGHLFAIRIFQGAAYSFFATAAYGYVAAAAPERRRGEAMGIFGLSFFVPFAIGGWLGEWVIGRAGFKGLFAASVAIAFLAGLLPLAVREPSRSSRVAFSSLWDFLSRPYFIPNSAAFLFGTAFGVVFTFVPVYLLVRPIASLGIFLVVYALSVIGTRTLARRLADRMARERLGLYSLFLIGGGIAGIPFIGSARGLVLVAAASGVGHGFLFPSLSALVLDRAGSEKGGMAMAMFTAAMDMGMVVGAGAFGFVAERHGYAAMFVSTALLTAAGALFFFTQDPSFRGAGRRGPAP